MDVFGEMLSEGDDEPLYECGRPTPEEFEALRTAIRAAGGPELDADAPMSVLRVHTAEDLREQAEVAADYFERADGQPGGLTPGSPSSST